MSCPDSLAMKVTNDLSADFIFKAFISVKPVCGVSSRSCRPPQGALLPCEPAAGTCRRRASPTSEPFLSRVLVIVMSYAQFQRDHWPPGSRPF